MQQMKLGLQRVVLLFCALFMLFAFNSSKVRAAEQIYVHNYFQYTVTDSSVTIVNYYGSDSEVTVPNMIAGNPVNTIASGAFASNDSVTKINLPDTIMTVEEGAFSGSQTVVFNSNTNEPSERQPDSTSDSGNDASADESGGSGNSQNSEDSSDESENSSGSSNANSSNENIQTGVDEQEAYLGELDESGSADESSESEESSTEDNRGIDEESIFSETESDTKEEAVNVDSSGQDIQDSESTENNIFPVVIAVIIIACVAVIVIMICKGRNKTKR